MYFKAIIRIFCILFFLLIGSGEGMFCLGQQANYRDSTRWDVAYRILDHDFKNPNAGILQSYI